jgi:hypothetical protein
MGEVKEIIGTDKAPFGRSILVDHRRLLEASMELVEMMFQADREHIQACS